MASHKLELTSSSHQISLFFISTHLEIITVQVKSTFENKVGWMKLKIISTQKFYVLLLVSLFSGPCITFSSIKQITSKTSLYNSPLKMKLQCTLSLSLHTSTLEAFSWQNPFNLWERKSRSWKYSVSFEGSLSLRLCFRYALHFYNFLMHVLETSLL